MKKFTDHIIALFLRSTMSRHMSNYRRAKALRDYRMDVWRMCKDVLFIAIGVASAAFGLKGFLFANNFIDGGATGLSLLIATVWHVPLSLIILIINIPFIFMGYNVIGKTFALKTAFAITLLAAVLLIVDFPSITQDKLLVAVFGGAFLGAGIGFAIRGGAVIDGTEVLAIYLSRKTSFTIGDIVALINVVIFSLAAYMLSIEIALYAMITYMGASKALDFVVEGIEEYMGVTIVSPHSNDIRKMITNKLGRGVTVYNGKRGYGKTGERFDTEIIFTVVTRLELSKLKLEVEKLDANAFVVMHSIKDTKGGVIKKRPLKH